MVTTIVTLQPYASLSTCEAIMKNMGKWVTWLYEITEQQYRDKRSTYFMHMINRFIFKFLK